MNERVEQNTARPRSSDPFYIVSCYIKWVTTSWTHTVCFRLLKPAAIGMYLTIFVDGVCFGVFDGFYPFFLVDELHISQQWIGKRYSWCSWSWGREWSLPPWRPSGSPKCYIWSCWWSSRRFSRKQKVHGGTGVTRSSTVPQQHFWLPQGLNVQGPGHRGCLQGVWSVIVGPVDDPLAGFRETKSQGAYRGSRTPTTLMTPSRPKWLQTWPP